MTEEEEEVSYLLGRVTDIGLVFLTVRALLPGLCVTTVTKASSS